MNTQSFAEKFERALTWNIKYLSERNFVLIISGIVGIVSGLAAVLLKESVHLIQEWLTSQPLRDSYFALLYPILGISISVVLAKLLYKEEQLGHAITDILYSISRKSSIIGKSKMYSRMVTSSFTVGFGGSAGLESPIVLTGSAIGSNIAQLVNFNYKLRTLMIGCGTAGVISAIFNAPIAGIIFSIEVIMVEVTVSTFIPLLIASVSATLVSIVLLGKDVVISFQLTDTFNAFDTPLYIALGVICGFTSKYFTDLLWKTSSQFDRISDDYLKVLLGGTLLSAILFFVPVVYGEGYGFIKAMLDNDHDMLLERSVFLGNDSSEWVMLGFLAAVIFIKAFASAVTIGCGGSGGTFAPSLFLGGVTGYAFAKFINLSGLGYISESNFALVGMCGILCGIQYAPLTAIFIIAELTGGYTLFIPLMMVSAISFSTVSFFNARSPYERELLQRGENLAKNPDRRVLNNLSIQNLIERDFKKVHDKAMLEDLVKIISISKRNVFPVVDSKGALIGIVTLDDVRDIMFDRERQKSVKISDVMQPPPATIDQHEEMEAVMDKFERSKAWNLPVTAQGLYVGFLSKSRIFNLYRQQLIEQGH